MNVKKSGVRKSRDAEATKGDLIAAAEALFAAHGFDGTKIDDIAARSGVNRALISYYFGSKEGLYDAVVAMLVANALSDVGPESFFASDPSVALKEFIVRLAHVMAKKSMLPALLMREYLAGPRAIREGPARDILKFYAVTERIYADGFRKKIFRKADPHVVHLALIGPVIHFVIAAPIREATFGKVVKGVTNPSVEVFASELADIVIAGLRRTD